MLLLALGPQIVQRDVAESGRHGHGVVVEHLHVGCHTDDFRTAQCIDVFQLKIEFKKGNAKADQ